MGIGCKAISIITIIVSFVLVGFIYFRYFYVLADGVKEGQLNYITHKGYLFKTYEGRLIQTGFKGTGTGMQSNEFIFSIENDTVAHAMERLSGLNLQLHYKEYNAPLPWRGYSNFVVDEIMSANGQTINQNILGNQELLQKIKNNTPNQETSTHE